MVFDSTKKVYRDTFMFFLFFLVVVMLVDLFGFENQIVWDSTDIVQGISKIRGYF